jgi:PIN domain nuclease of toxin-antitoxin system
LLHDEPGADAVAEALPGAVASAVNVSEAMAKLAEAGMPEPAIDEALAALGLEIHPFDATLALSAAMLRPKTRSRGLSFGDRACLALGLRLSLPVMTADRDWKALKLGVKVELIR